MPEPLALAMSYAEAARRLGISEKTIPVLIARSELKTIVLPGQVRPKVLRSSVETMFKQIYEVQPQAV
jgi:transposase